MAYDPNNKFDVELEKAKSEVSTHGTLVAVILVMVLAFAGYFFYAHNTAQPVFSKTTVENGYDSSKAAVTPDKPASK